MDRNSTTSVWKNRWRTFATSAVTLTVLLAVPALGLTQLGVGADPIAFSDSPLTFDGPTSTMEKLGLTDNAANTAEEGILSLDDWKYTKSKPGPKPPPPKPPPHPKPPPPPPPPPHHSHHE
jgi:hypothetical protein